MKYASVRKLREQPADNSQSDGPRTTKFGETNTADHKVLNEEGQPRNNQRYAIVLQELATPWIQSYPCKTKTSQATPRNLRKFLDPKENPKVLNTDNSFNSEKLVEILNGNQSTSTPYQPETNGIAERAVSRVKEGTSSVST